MADQPGRGRRAGAARAPRTPPRSAAWRRASEAKEGDPSKVLVELADKHDADLLVIGNKGMKRKVLGSVPNTVSHKARLRGADRQDDLSALRSLHEQHRTPPEPHAAPRPRAARLSPRDRRAATAGLVAVVGLILSIAGVIGSTLWVIAAIVAAVCAFLFWRTVSK